MVYGDKYYNNTLEREDSKIGRVYFKFYFPSTEEIFKATKMTELEFQNKVNKKYSAEKYLSQLKRKQAICKYNLN